MSVIAVIGLVLTCIIGLWKFVARLKSEKRKAADEAQKLFKEGIEAGDPSRITVGFDRVNRVQ